MANWSNSSGLDLHLTLPAGRGRRAALEEALREAIASGRLRAGHRLPATRTLAADLGTARGTVAEAYAQLAAEGWLRARRGAGTEVAAVASRLPAARTPAAPLPPPPRHDLRPGHPDVSAFPRAAWTCALRAALEGAPDAVLQGNDPRGLPELREALAGYLGRARGVRAEPERVLVCGGFRQGLSLVCRALARRGLGRVALEDPTVPYHPEVAEAAGATVLDLPLDELGARTELLAGLRADAAVVTPAHQFPLGVTLAPERRAALVAWARETGGVVIEDDYDGEFRYDRQPVGALQALDPEHVVYAGTASKALAPGLRLGWLVLPASLAELVAREKDMDDGGAAVTDQLALCELIRGHGLDRHLRSVRARYRRRRDVLLGALSEAAPGLRARGIAAGLHALVELPPGGPGEQELVERAAERELALSGLAEMRRTAAPGPPALVVGYATPPEHGYAAAVAVLAGLLKELSGG